MVRKFALTLALIALVVAPLAAEEPVRWLNVHVVEADSEANVEVRLPLDLVATVISSVKTEQLDQGKVKLDMVDMDETEVDLARILEAVKDAPDGEFIKVTEGETKVTVAKRGGTVHIDVTEPSEETEVNVTFPAELIDALQVGPDNVLDVNQVIARLAELPNGDLVRVSSAEANVRVWIE